MIRYLIILKAKIYYSKRIQSKISQGKPGMNFQESYFFSHTGHTQSPQQQIITVQCYQESSTETRCSGLLLGAAHVDTICLA